MLPLINPVPNTPLSPHWASKAMGFLTDVAVSLPRHIRHNGNLVWVAVAGSLTGS
ncbi:hypothetical protein [Candidatus Seongchinamella marina]|jgi:hypothetical protein|uniref:hypothetical protein n=1 Tax=Candidatus Seongchinamella marina TaxID=2518990 RepID=UPI00242FE5C8|nr:hypothetical protein [Candidatus Seongchinamella marina]